MRNEHYAQKQRAKNKPVEQEIADVQSDRGPRISREQPELRRQKVAVGAQLAQLGRLSEGVVFRHRVTAALDELGEDRCIVSLVKPPRRQPAANVPAARHSREIMEMPQQPVARQGLQHTERKGRAADAAAGQAKRGWWNLQRVDAPIEILQIAARPAGLRARARRTVQLLELLLQHSKQRQGLRRRAVLGGTVGSPAWRSVADHAASNTHLFMRWILA